MKSKYYVLLGQQVVNYFLLLFILGGVKGVKNIMGKEHYELSDNHFR